MAKMPPRRDDLINPRTNARRKPTFTGPIGRAKILTDEQFQTALDQTAESLYPTRDRLYLLLSRYAGLRAKEIATLHVEDVVDVTGKVNSVIEVSKRGAKYGKERSIPMRAELKAALEEYLRDGDIDRGPVFWGYHGKPVTANSVAKQIKAIYVNCGFRGARSHSGRRHFITAMARKANTVGASLVDVQKLAGHADLETTALYIDPARQAEKLIEIV